MMPANPRDKKKSRFIDRPKPVQPKRRPPMMLATVSPHHGVNTMPAVVARAPATVCTNNGM